MAHQRRKKINYQGASGAVDFDEKAMFSQGPSAIIR
jgi:hypothetical protein